MKHKTTFTPGPWSIGSIAGKITVNRDRSSPLAVMTGNARIDELNAAVMAAAPELLEALKQVLAPLKDFEPKQYPAEIERRTKLAEAAIAKAEGKHS